MSSKRNIYTDDVDFAALAAQDSDFAKILKPNRQLDFSDPESVQQLTKSLLKRDFNLSLSLPPDRLCPPVPNRLNYILWIQDLLDTSSDSYSDQYDSRREAVSLDIGTGASCIYPLLGCAQRPKWRFLGTDIDDKSLTYAQRNVKSNNLSHRIKLLKTSPNDPLIPLDTLNVENLDFTLCNPPFYTTNSELLISASQKSRPPNSACTGSATEMVTPGGETAFVCRMIQESLVLRERVQWYTSMLGKMSSVSVVVERLRKEGIGNYAVTEFVQGSRTRRWGVGWSFGDGRPGAGCARGLGAASGVARGLLPFLGEYVIRAREGREDVVERINEVIESLPLRWVWKEGIATGVGFASGNVWSRAARRKSARIEQQGEGMGNDEDEDEDDMAFGFKITVTAEDGAKGGPEKQETVRVTVRWLKGLDSTMFESFCGMVKRKLDD